MAEHEHKPRIVLLTYPGLVGAHVINTFTACENIELVGIGLSSRVFKGANHLQSVKRMTQRSGWRFTGWEIVMTDLAWWLLRLCGVPEALRKTPVLRIQDINAVDTLDWVAGRRPDYIASCFFNQVIEPSVTMLAPGGCINLHAGPLPWLRGPEPCFRALQKRLRRTGLTIHQIDSTDIDTGPILYQEYREIPPGLSVTELDVRLWSDGAHMTTRWLAGDIVAGPKRLQSKSEGSYDSWPTAADVHDLQSRGHRLMNWKAYIEALRAARQGGAPTFLSRLPEPDDYGRDDVLVSLG